MNRTLKEARRWAAVMARDAACDGTFYYSVTSTGVYCRPSCAARRPKRENVRFHATCADAEAAGFRPCKRCKPNAPTLHREHAEKVARACRLIEGACEAPDLAVLAKVAGLSPHHFHRVFKDITGLTPNAYAAACRHARVRDNLRKGGAVTRAIYESGFGSAGRFYADASKMLGMTPSRYRTGGTGAELLHALGQCSLGAILVAASQEGIAAILMGDDPAELLRDLRDRFPKAKLVAGDRDFAELVSRVIAHVEAPDTSLDLPLDIRGTAFQHRVWMALRDIPVGTTATYAEIAQRIGAPKAVRAVAGACAANALAVAIPCHRVVRSDGSLSGYRWGVARKRALLKKEAKS
jgi:AraC family transcriptional regulator, regulatory protein of adaptative response / methylated-DNA-[protein]-cysteine methyltransferase